MTETNLPKRVLLVGGTSLIGQSIADKNGVEIVTPTRKELDLANYNSVDNWLKKYKFDHALHTRFKQYFKMLDSVRGTNFVKTFNPSWA